MSELQHHLDAIQRIFEEYRKIITFIIVDADGTILDWSEEAGLLLADKPNHLKGASIFAIMPEFIGLEETLKEIASRKQETFELPRLQRSGQRWDTRYLTIRLLPFQGEGEVIIIIEDVTESATLIQQLMQGHNELELMRDKLTQSEKRFQDILENAGDVVFATDSAGIIQYINPRIKALSAYTPEELTGKHFLTLLPEAHREPLEAHYKQQLAGSISESLHEFPIQRKDDGQRWVEQRVTLLRENGEVRGLQGIVRDITARKEAQDKAAQYQRTLEQRNRELDAYNHSVAHDLKSPLTAMTSYAELLRVHEKDRLSAKGREFLDQIRQTAFRMSDMINGLLVLSTIEAAQYELGAVELKPVIEAAVGQSAEAIKQRGITLTIPESLPAVIGHRPWLEQVFDNLLGNAVKFIGKENPTPIIAILSEEKDGRVRIGVRDNGLGIPADGQEVMFDMFSRFHAKEAPGTGLGLSIVKRIVDKCGGTVSVDSAVGKGTTIWIEMVAVESTQTASEQTAPDG